MGWAVVDKLAERNHGFTLVPLFYSGVEEGKMVGEEGRREGRRSVLAISPHYWSTVCTSTARVAWLAERGDGKLGVGERRSGDMRESGLHIIQLGVHSS